MCYFSMEACLRSCSRRFRCSMENLICTPFSSICERFISLSAAQSIDVLKDSSEKASHEKSILFLCETGQLQNAIHTLANSFVHPSDSTYISLLRACIKKKALSYAKNVVEHVLLRETEKSGLLLDYLIISLARCGGVDDAWELHCTLHRNSAACWSSLICGYADCRKWREVTHVYHLMVENGVEPDHFAYVSLFKACSSIQNLNLGQALHDEVKQRGLTSNLYIANSILSMYGRCGSMKEAEVFFCDMKQHNIISWNAMLSGYLEHGQPVQALLLYRQIHAEAVQPNELTFLMAIKACCLKETENFDGFAVGEALHADACKKEFTSNLLVASTLMCLYGKYKELARVESVFTSLVKHNVITWTTLLKSYVDRGQGRRVLPWYAQMVKEGFQLDGHTYVLFLQACCSLAEAEESVLVAQESIKLQSLEIVKALHEDAKRRDLAVDTYLGSTLINLYGKCGSISDAKNVFGNLLQQDVVVYNTMLAAYVGQGLGEESLNLYTQMMEEGIVLDEWTAVEVLQACIICIDKANENALEMGKYVLFGQSLCMDICKLGYINNNFVGNTLINLYGKCGMLLEAESVFILLAKRDIASWNVMLNTYIEQDYGELAVQLYRQLLEEDISPDERTFVAILQSCSILLDSRGSKLSIASRKLLSLEIVLALHSDAKNVGFSSQVFVANSLITSYAKCGAIREAESVFSSLTGHSVVSWNAMLSAYIEQGQGALALQLFSKMLKVGAIPDAQTFVIVLQAACLLGKEREEAGLEGVSASWDICQALHAEAKYRNLARNVFVGNTLTRLYSKLGKYTDATEVFKGICQRNLVTWNAMLSGLVEQGDGEEALHLFKEMQEKGVSPNEITLVNILQASGIVDCQAVFDSMHQVRSESWNAILTGFAGEGNLLASLRLFEEMCCCEIAPTSITFFALLMACSHTGLVENALQLFLFMGRHCGLHAGIKHYAIMADQLGRAGNFEKVESMLSRMPMKPDIAFWSCLLSACRVHGHFHLGKKAYDYALQLQPNDTSVYVNMSNIYADVRRIYYLDLLESS
ncbi:hypothetical protein KP509_21G062900 [Ceratopteris richardii]|uniref:Pentatricopeptide repeat-containing protein n=1 Tax=Ceratopteris richardii TaxID=49495 RepID=A0A8T2SDI3_CERRI|nr:hypothetical protein KP509_21G062900 [Ceratopteris richardii]